MTMPNSTARKSLNSRIDTVLAEDGDYVIVVTTYPAGHDRRLPAQPAAEPRPAAPGERAGRTARDRLAGRRLRLWRTDEQSRQYRRRRARALQQPAQRRHAPSGEPAARQRGSNDRGRHPRLAPDRAAVRSERPLPLLLLGPWRPGRRAGQRRRAGRARGDDRAVRRGDDRCAAARRSSPACGAGCRCW